MVVVALLVAGAAFQYVFYELIEDAGLPEHQVIYMSHFFFYAALSVMFLAFGKSLEPKGIFKDLKDSVQSGMLGPEAGRTPSYQIVLGALLIVAASLAAVFLHHA